MEGSIISTVPSREKLQVRIWIKSWADPSPIICATYATREVIVRELWGPPQKPGEPPPGEYIARLPDCVDDLENPVTLELDRDSILGFCILSTAGRRITPVTEQINAKPRDGRQR